MEKINWTDHVRNEEILLRVKEQRNILHEIRKRKANWIGHILRRNCLLQRVTEGRMLTSPVPNHTTSRPERYPNWCIKRAVIVADVFDHSR